MIKGFRILAIVCATLLASNAHAQLDALEANKGTEESNIASNPSLENVEVIDFPVPSADNIMWSKTLWRMIDLREKVNHPMYFPQMPTDGRQSLFTYMFKLIKDGKINAYRYNEAKEDFSASNIMPFSEIVGPEMLDLIYDIELDENGDSVGIRVNEADIPSRQIFKFYLKEVWYFDKHESTMKVKVLGLCPQRYWNSADLGETKAALFWVNYDEIRPYLAQQPVVLNDFNNSQRMSYDDLFLKRRFSSYIYKESNIYNRSLIEYCNSVEEVHAEQERIKKEILNYEQDLWEY